MAEIESISRSPSPENDVFAISSTLVPERVAKVASTTTIDFDHLLHPPLLLHEDLQNGCGGQLWPAGMTLSKYVLSHHKNLIEQSIIEIGAGGGLVGLAVALGCKTNQKILITDQEPMYELMQKNISLNKLENKVSAEIYDWGTRPPQLRSANDRSMLFPDIVLAADCVYFEPSFPLLLQTLIDLVGPNTTCYFCFKKRRKADMRFIRDMHKRFDVQQVDYEDREMDQREGIWLYKVTLKVKR